VFKLKQDRRKAERQQGTGTVDVVGQIRLDGTGSRNESPADQPW